MDFAKVFKGRFFDGAYVIEVVCYVLNIIVLYK